MENIKKLRGKAGLTQKQLADKVGVTRTTINNYESKGKKHIGDKMAVKMCDIFNVSLCELYGLDNIRYLPSNSKEKENLINLINNL